MDKCMLKYMLKSTATAQFILDKVHRRRGSESGGWLGCYDSLHPPKGHDGFKVREKTPPKEPANWKHPETISTMNRANGCH